MYCPFIQRWSEAKWEQMLDQGRNILKTFCTFSEKECQSFTEIAKTKEDNPLPFAVSELV